MASRRKKQKQRGRIARIGILMLANPVASGGGFVMAAMAAAIMTNALALQPGAHPAPLFRDIRPVGPEEAAEAHIASREAEMGSLDDLVERTTGRARPAVDSGLVADIQRELKARGYYPGEVDGLTGPMTSAAILRFEEATGLDPVGEPTSDVLAALRKGPEHRSEAPPVPVPPRAPQRPLSAEMDDLVRPEPAVARARDLPRAEPAVARVAEPDEDLDAVPDEPLPDPRLAKVQESLDLLGYGPLKPDGHWTPETRAAIRRFEENRGLEITGEINQAFVTELVRIGGLALE